MHEAHWHIHERTGFLIHPQPVPDLRTATGHLPSQTIFMDAIETTAHVLPALIASGQVREHLAQLPPLPTDMLDNLLTDCAGPILERLFMLYGYFASAYVLAPPNAHKILPAIIAQPLLQLASQLKRPPMLSYAGLVLNNWRLHDENGAITLENVALLQQFTMLDDERWFFMVHIAIEAQAGSILSALQDGMVATERDDEPAALQALRDIRAGLVEITRIFNRMPERCDPDSYFHAVRPYFFGFDDVVFAGYEDANGQTHSLRGGSGAQSSIVPAVLAGLGVQHDQNSLTRHLYTMRDYMPVPHRHFIETMRTSKLRDYATQHPPLRDAYNHALRQLMTFRRAHLHYARTYIFAKTMNPYGTGGTPFMDFLKQLIAETDAHLLR